MAKKKPRVQAKTGANALPAELTPEQRRARLLAVKEDVEDSCGGNIDFAEDTHNTYLLRRRTGILSLDLGLAGGFPAGAPSVIVGPDGSGKDYLLWRTAAETQQLYGDHFAMFVYCTEFKLDKLFMKNVCGLQVAFSDSELKEMDEARHMLEQPLLTAEEIDYYKYQVGTFISLIGSTADKGFDVMERYLVDGMCQIIAINSIGCMQTEAKENVDSFEDHPQQRNEAALLSRVMPKFSMILNRKLDTGGPNESTLLYLNQVRSKDGAARPIPGRPVLARDGYKSASNSMALKHAKAIELMIHNGSFIYDESVKPPKKIGLRKDWELTKGKLGTHEGIRGSYDFLYEGAVDILSDLVRVAVGLGIITQKGAWYSFSEGGFSFNLQGEDKVVPWLKNNPECVELIRTLAVAVHGLTCRYV